MTKLADELKHWRHYYRLTQTEAAAVLSYSLAQYGRFERGTLSPPLNQYQRIHSVIYAMDLADDRARDGVSGE